MQSSWRAWTAAPDPHRVAIIAQLFNFFIWIGMGCLCSFLAQARGRSAFGWFLVGLVAPVVGLILVLVLPDENHRRGLRRENQRLREQIRMSQTVADRRQRDIERRLDLHDEALDLDTTAPLQEIEEARAEELVEAQPYERDEPEEPDEDEEELVAGAPAAERPEPEEIRWYYAKDGKESEAIDIVELRDLWRSGEVAANTLIWNNYLDNWTTIGSIPGLVTELDA